jgi:colicin import membrane protein
VRALPAWACRCNWHPEGTQSLNTKAKIHLEFAPPAQPGAGRAWVLAGVAHALLFLALGLATAWKTQPQTVQAEAELWSALPASGCAAPARAATGARTRASARDPSHPLGKTCPPPPPAPDPALETRDAQIALEKKKQLEKKKDAEKAEKLKAEKEKAAKEKEKAKAEKAKAEKEKAETKRKEIEKEKLAKEKKAQEEKERDKKKAARKPSRQGRKSGGSPG